MIFLNCIWQWLFFMESMAGGKPAVKLTATLPENSPIYEILLLIWDISWHLVAAGCLGWKLSLILLKFIARALHHPLKLLNLCASKPSNIIQRLFVALSHQSSICGEDDGELYRKSPIDVVAVEQSLEASQHSVANAPCSKRAADSLSRSSPIPDITKDPLVDCNTKPDLSRSSALHDQPVNKSVFEDQDSVRHPGTVVLGESLSMQEMMSVFEGRNDRRFSDTSCDTSCDVGKSGGFKCGERGGRKQHHVSCTPPRRVDSTDSRSSPTSESSRIPTPSPLSSPAKKRNKLQKKEKRR